MVEVGSEAIASLQPRPLRVVFPPIEDTMSGMSIDVMHSCPSYKVCTGS